LFTSEISGADEKSCVIARKTPPAPLQVTAPL